MTRWAQFLVHQLSESDSLLHSIWAIRKKSFSCLESYSSFIQAVRAKGGGAKEVQLAFVGDCEGLSGLVRSDSEDLARLV